MGLRILYTAGWRQKGSTSKLDLDVTYGPVVKVNIVHVEIGIIASGGWKIKQLNVNNAFQPEGVDVGIHFKQPHGFEDQQEPAPRVWKLFHKFRWKLSIMMLGVEAEGEC